MNYSFETDSLVSENTALNKHTSVLVFVKKISTGHLGVSSVFIIPLNKIRKKLVE